MRERQRRSAQQWCDWSLGQAAHVFELCWLGKSISIGFSKHLLKGNYAAYDSLKSGSASYGLVAKGQSTLTRSAAEKSSASSTIIGLCHNMEKRLKANRLWFGILLRKRAQEQTPWASASAYEGKRKVSHHCCGLRCGSSGLKVRHTRLGVL